MPGGLLTAFDIRTVENLDEFTTAVFAIGQYFGLVPTEERMERFRDQITFTDTATPETMEHYTLNHRGAIYGWEATPNQSTGKRLKQRAPIDGLFLAGHWTEPGAGSFRAIYSGMTAALLAAGLESLPEFLGALEARATV